MEWFEDAGNSFSDDGNEVKEDEAGFVERGFTDGDRRGIGVEAEDGRESDKAAFSRDREDGFSVKEAFPEFKCSCK